MGTDVRATISKKNPYYISKHRFYELKHYCLQYNEWKRLKRELEDSLISSSKGVRTDLEWIDPTGNIAVKIHDLSLKMKEIEDLVCMAGKELSKYLFIAVTEGVSYTYLKTVLNIPCSKEYFYKQYRKFWWLLSNDKSRNLHVF